MARDDRGGGRDGRAPCPVPRVEHAGAGRRHQRPARRRGADRGAAALVAAGQPAGPDAGCRGVPDHRRRGRAGRGDVVHAGRPAGVGVVAAGGRDRGDRHGQRRTASPRAAQGARAVDGPLGPAQRAPRRPRLRVRAAGRLRADLPQLDPAARGRRRCLVLRCDRGPDRRVDARAAAAGPERGRRRRRPDPRQRGRGGDGGRRHPADGDGHHRRHVLRRLGRGRSCLVRRPRRAGAVVRRRPPGGRAVRLRVARRRPRAPPLRAGAT
jgi:hypothetical protein